MSRNNRWINPDLSKAEDIRPDRRNKRTWVGHVDEDIFAFVKSVAASLGLNTDLATHDMMATWLEAHGKTLPPALLEKMFVVLAVKRHKHDQ